ncbi:hypothetical protein BC936DRAFT_140642 [Jimgerdemannia flammicorona]|uniref:Uncharacterized protein n=2 Tax=Jimgerdemannia flammicorona TaxID=994334 RepID=A0A433AHB4_9FUNG|nr:hypothetical protein BC936DRAFT_140642 [Jimgerdemannia flammicorona]RUS24942.1 hypothetical protein BC938DRAFT_472849 [Jimgerdemannia flammicorona]
MSTHKDTEMAPPPPYEEVQNSDQILTSSTSSVATGDTNLGRFYQPGPSHYPSSSSSSAAPQAPMQPHKHPVDHNVQHQRSHIVLVRGPNRGPRRGYYYRQEREALLHSRDERRFPLAALLFLLGWFIPILWFFGACCCIGSHNRYEVWWGKLNLLMSIVSLMFFLAWGLTIAAAILLGSPIEMT